MNGTPVLIGEDGQVEAGPPSLMTTADLSKVEPRELVDLYHRETKAGGSWTRREDGTMGSSRHLEAINKELKRRIPKKRLTIDDLENWARGQPLRRRNRPED
jgi:hypothetical protein